MRRGIFVSILLLGFGVFLWGTAYKMSLYESSPIHNKVPVAKLLTDSNKASRDQMGSAATPRPLQAFPLLLDLALFFFALSLLSGDSPAATVETRKRPAQLHFPPAQFLRPPPFLLHG